MNRLKEGAAPLNLVVMLVILGLSMVLSRAATAGPATPKTDPSESRVSLAERKELNLPPAAKKGLKLTMQEHLETIGAIVAALGREDFSQAATLANDELGFPKHHEAMQREQGATFPPAYHELAMAHHTAAESLGKVILTKELKQILPQLDRTIHACVKCHQAFRLRD